MGFADNTCYIGTFTRHFLIGKLDLSYAFHTELYA